MSNKEYLQWIEDMYAAQMSPAQAELFRSMLHPHGRGAVIDFSHYPNRRPIIFDNQGNLVSEDVIETTGRVVDKKSPKESAIAKPR